MFPSSDPRGLMREAEFDWGETKVGIDAEDPLANYFQTDGVVMKLESDSESLSQDVKRIMESGCRCKVISAFICIPCLPCILCQTTCPDENRINTIRTASDAHRLILNQDSIVFERDNHSAFVVKNYIASDQYGARYSGVAEQIGNIGAAKVHVPLSKAHLELVPMKDLPPPLFVDSLLQTCCASEATPKGHVLILSAGEGVKVQVACIDVGHNSKVEEFIQKFNDTKNVSSIGSVELDNSYEQWLHKRLSNAGTMTGTHQYNKTIGGLHPGPCGVQGGQAGALYGFQNVSVTEIGATDCGPNDQKIPHGFFAQTGSPFTNYVSNLDRLSDIRGTSLMGLDGGQFAEAFRQTGATNPLDTFQVQTSVPTWQPCTVRTIGPLSDRMDADSQTMVGGQKPPRLIALGPQSAGTGLQYGDIILKLVIHRNGGGDQALPLCSTDRGAPKINDKVVDTSTMTGVEFLQALPSAHAELQGCTYTLTVASQAGVSGVSTSFPDHCSKKRILPWLPYGRVDQPGPECWKEA